LTEGKAGFVVRRLTGKEQRLIKPFGVAERALNGPFVRRKAALCPSMTGSAPALLTAAPLLA
jgi:hypothetical protein